MSTPTKGLPELSYSQASKHITHNEALRIIDGLLLLSVQDKDLTTPPAELLSGVCYIPASPATGDWEGYENYIAQYYGNGWYFYEPWYGWYTFVTDENKFYWWDNNTWQPFASVLASGTDYWSQLGEVVYTLSPVAIGKTTASGVMLDVDGGIRCTELNVNGGSVSCGSITTSDIDVNGDITTYGIKIDSATDWFGSASVSDVPALTSSGITNSTVQAPSATNEVVWYDGEWETMDINFATVANQVNDLRQDVSDLRLQLNDLLAQLRVTGGCGVIDD